MMLTNIGSWTEKTLLGHFPIDSLTKLFNGYNIYGTTTITIIAASLFRTPRRLLQEFIIILRTFFGFAI